MHVTKTSVYSSRFFYYLLFLLVMSFFWGQAIANDSEWVEVATVIDGDTLRLNDGRWVRLIGIDTAEIDHRNAMAEPWAVEAWQALAQMTNGGRVHLKYGPDRFDSHGRLLAHVFDERGNWVNEQMISRGLAHVLYVEPNIEAFPKLLVAQQKAINSRIGQWKTYSANQGPWVGNQRTRRFHAPQCPLVQQIQPKTKVLFSNQKQSFLQGYAPCRRCIILPKKELKR